MPSPLVPVIAGPTASGKTSVAVELCRIIRGEMISADSMQVYRHLSIGTAKPTAAELGDVPCHLVDHVEPWEQYHLGRFVQEAMTCMEDIRSRGRIPVICGGTGMYIRGLIYGIFDGGERAQEVREQLQARLSDRGLAALYEELEKIDPDSARRYGPNDQQRILRALEVWHTTGTPFSQHHKQSTTEPVVPAEIFILQRPRPLLYERINMRVDGMVEAGLIKEVQNYLDKGYDRSNPALRALGYSEVIEALEQKRTLESALEIMKQKSRNYAKRQETWFKAVSPARRVALDNKTARETAEVICGQWEKAASRHLP